MEVKKTAVIIGGGISGCICALLLARKNFNVTVVEKEKDIGGLFSVFKRKDILFDIGFHYAGALQKGQFLFESLNKLGLLSQKDVEPVSFIDSVYVAGRIYSIGGGIKQFVSSLKNDFPDENGLDELFYRITQCANSFYNIDEPENLIMNTTTLDEVLDDLIKSEKLKTVIKYISYLYGSDSGEGQFNLHALLLHDIIQSPGKIIGGSETVMSHVKHQFKKYGVKVMTKIAVNKVVSDEKGVQFKSLLLSDGSQMGADICISTIHPYLLEGIFTSNSKNEKRVINKIKHKENGYSGFSTYFKYHGSLKSNYYFFNDSLKAEIGVLAGECSGDFQSVTTFIKTDWSIWKNILEDKKAIFQLKKEYEAKTISLINKYMPEVANNFEVLDSASPLTYVRYTGTLEGSFYGLKCSAAEKGIHSLLPTTKLKGFYIGGQSLFYPGLMGCYCSSVAVVDVVEKHYALA